MKRDWNTDRKRLKADPRGRRSERSRLRRAAIRGAPVVAAALTLIAAGRGGEEPVAGKPAGAVSPESVTAPAEPTDAPPTATTTTTTTTAAAVTTTLIATTATTPATNDTTTTTTAAAEADDDTTAAAGADVLELDVQLTADNVLIVQHDDAVDRTTEANGPVAERTLAEIQTLDNAYWFAPGRWGDRSRPPKDNLPGCHN